MMNGRGTREPPDAVRLSEHCTYKLDHLLSDTSVWNVLLIITGLGNNNKKEN
jgi:hypothetical protein